MGRECNDFPSKLLCLTVPKHFVEERFCVLESFRYRKMLWIRGEYHDFLSKIYCLTNRKKFVREPLNVSKNLGYEKIFA